MEIKVRLRMPEICHEINVTPEDLDMSEQYWKKLSNKEQEEALRDYVADFDPPDWKITSFKEEGNEKD